MCRIELAMNTITADKTIGSHKEARGIGTIGILLGVAPYGGGRRGIFAGEATLLKKQRQEQLGSNVGSTGEQLGSNRGERLRRATEESDWGSTALAGVTVALNSQEEEWPICLSCLCPCPCYRRRSEPSLTGRWS